MVLNDCVSLLFGDFETGSEVFACLIEEGVGLFEIEVLFVFEFDLIVEAFLDFGVVISLFFEKEFELLFVLFFHVLVALAFHFALLSVEVDLIFVESDFGFELQFMLLPEAHESNLASFLNFADLLFGSEKLILNIFLQVHQLVNLLIVVTILHRSRLVVLPHLLLQHFHVLLVLF